MKKIVQGLIFSSTILLALPVFSEGHLRVINETHNTVNVECGHDGQSGHTKGVHPDHSKGMSIHGHGQIHCIAKNDHGHQIASRQFDFEHGNESYNWYVNQGH